MNLTEIRYEGVELTGLSQTVGFCENCNEHSGYITSKLTSCNRALLEKLTVTQLAKKVPAFYGNRRLITVFTRARHWTLL